VFELLAQPPLEALQAMHIEVSRRTAFLSWNGGGLEGVRKGFGGGFTRGHRLCLGLDTWVNYLAARSHKSIFRSIFAALKLFCPLSLKLTLLLFSCRFWLRYISKRRCGRQSLRNSFPRDKQQNGKWSVAVWIAAEEVYPLTQL